MTFGLDVIFQALVMKGVSAANPPVEVFIIPLGTERECMKILMELRKQGIKADLEMADRKLKKSLDYANKQEIPYVIIIGENEINSGRAKLKDMVKGSEVEINLMSLKRDNFFR